MKYESAILKRLIDTYGVIGNPKYMSEIIKQFIVQGKECFPHLFTYQADWLAHIDEFGLTSDYVVSYTGQQIYAPHTKEKPVKRAILSGQTLVNVIDKISFHGSATLFFYMYLKQYEINKDYLFMIFNAPQEITEVYVGNSASTIVWRNYTSDFVRNGSTISLKVTCPSNYDGSTILPHIRYGGASLSIDVLKQIKVMLIPYQQGMENWDIPYFEGMQSVKMPVLTTTNEDGTKSNILTVNGDVTLRGIGDVEDTLDCLTGELTQRIGEFVLDGSEEWSINNSNNEGFFSCSTTTYVGVPNGKVISDKLPSVTSTKTEGVMMGVTTGKLLVSFNRDKTGVTSLAKFKEKLAQLQLKVCYEIENVDKTVDLSVKDQDNQVINQLSTFEGGTHFTTSSQEGSLLPSLTVDVVTNLEETLKVCSLEGNTM